MLGDSQVCRSECGRVSDSVSDSVSSGPIPLAALKQALLSALVLPSIFPAHWILNELQNAVSSDSLRRERQQHDLLISIL